MEKQNASDLGNQSPDKLPRVYHVNVLLVNNLVFRITKSMHIARLCLAKCLLGLPLNGFAKPQQLCFSWLSPSYSIPSFPQSEVKEHCVRPATKLVTKSLMQYCSDSASIYLMGLLVPHLSLRRFCGLNIPLSVNFTLIMNCVKSLHTICNMKKNLKPRRLHLLTWTSVSALIGIKSFLKPGEGDVVIMLF